MDINAQPDTTDRVALVRVLLLLQAAIVATATVEALVIGGASANTVSLGAVNLAALAWTLWLRDRTVRGTARTWRWLRRTQTAWIALAVVDAILALWLAQRFLEPVPIVTRLVLPIALRRMASAALDDQTRTVVSSPPASMAAHLAEVSP